MACLLFLCWNLAAWKKLKRLQERDLISTRKIVGHSMRWVSFESHLILCIWWKMQENNISQHCFNLHPGYCCNIWISCSYAMFFNTGVILKKQLSLWKHARLHGMTVCHSCMYIKLSELEFLSSGFVCLIYRTFGKYQFSGWHIIGGMWLSVTWKPILPWVKSLKYMTTIYGRSWKNPMPWDQMYFSFNITVYLGNYSIVSGLKFHHFRYTWMPLVWCCDCLCAVNLIYVRVDLRSWPMF